MAIAPKPAGPETPLVALLVSADPKCRAVAQGSDERKIAWRHAETLDDALGQLSQRAFDAVVVDLALDAGPGALTAIRQVRPLSAIVAIGDQTDEEAEFESVRRGVQELVARATLDPDTLLEATRRALNRLWIAAFADEHGRALEAICEALPAAICAVGELGLVTYVNRGWEALAGRGEDALGAGKVGAALLESMIADAELTDLAEGARLTAEGVLPLFTGEVRRREGGEERWYSARVARTNPRGGVLLMLMDVTYSHQAEQAQRKWSAQYRDLLDNLPIGIAVHQDGHIVWVNQRLCDALGYEAPGALLGASAEQLLHAEDCARVLGEDPSASPSGRASEPVEARLLRADGAAIEVSVRVFPAEFEGRPCTVLVTRELAAERELNARLMQMDRMVSVGLLAAGVGHEINTPLSFVSANVDLALRKILELEAAFSQLSKDQRDPELRARAEHASADLAELREGLTEARVGYKRVQAIVKGLKSFSSPRSKEHEATDLPRVVHAAIGLTWNEIRHRARLDKEIEPTQPVVGTEAELGQVLLNVLLNAAQAIEPGKAHENRIVVRVKSAAGRALIEVSDTGSGIAPEALERIFEPFFSTKPVGHGTGLGLAICRNTVLRLGGDITLESSVGKGTTVRISLPFSSKPPPKISTVSPLEAEGHPLNILVVDDEPLIGRSVARCMGRQHTTRAVSSAREALDLLAAGATFDVIFLDVMMPEMSGIELFRQLERTAPALLGRVVFLTGGAFAGGAQEALDALPNRKLFKPFEPREVRAAAQEVAAAQKVAAAQGGGPSE